MKVAPLFFATPKEFRAWLHQHHAVSQELLVEFYKRGTGRPSITWPESVDQALCFGWIDGVRRSIDEHSYTIRFTPRKPRSTWSAINIKRVAELTRLELIQPAGLKAFEARLEHRSAIYAYEQRLEVTLDEVSQRQFRSNRKAWKFFEAQPPWYRRTATYWVVSAKRPETRLKRLDTLILDSEAGRRIGPLNRPAKTK